MRGHGGALVHADSPVEDALNETGVIRGARALRRALWRRRYVCGARAVRVTPIQRSNLYPTNANPMTHATPASGATRHAEVE